MIIINFATQNDADFIHGFAYQLADGTPINITGSTLRMGVRVQPSDITEAMLLTTATGELPITDPVNGAFSIMLSMAQLQQLPVGSYVHSMVMTLASGEHRLMWNGVLTHSDGPSRLSQTPPSGFTTITKASR
jgi:hypothetical protein